jgi:transmembrane sensor
MTPKPQSVPPSNEIERAAASWVLRLDRGLTPTEQDELSQWLAADPRHGKVWSEQRWGWEELDRLAGLQTALGGTPNPDLLAPPKRARAVWLKWTLPVVLAAAAALAVMLWQQRPAPVAPPRAVGPGLSALAAPCERLLLPDGSTVDLNRGARLETAYTPAERRVRLLTGEANFTVAKNPDRPFVVESRGVEVRAVGTVFNVKLDQAGVEVLVTEGKVKVQAPAVAGAPREIQLVGINQRTLVATVAPQPARVETLAAEAVSARLAWQPRLLDFTNAPLPEIVAEFNRSNPVRLVLAEASLETMRLSATFRSDNVESFVRLMESDFGLHAEWRGEREIALTRAK